MPRCILRPLFCCLAVVDPDKLLIHPGRSSVPILLLDAPAFDIPRSRQRPSKRIKSPTDSFSWKKKSLADVLKLPFFTYLPILSAAFGV